MDKLNELVSKVDQQVRQVREVRSKFGKLKIDDRVTTNVLIRDNYGSRDKRIIIYAQLDDVESAPFEMMECDIWREAKHTTTEEGKHQIKFVTDI